MNAWDGISMVTYTPYSVLPVLCPLSLNHLSSSPQLICSPPRISPSPAGLHLLLVPGVCGSELPGQVTCPTCPPVPPNHLSHLPTCPISTRTFNLQFLYSPHVLGDRPPCRWVLDPANAKKKENALLDVGIIVDCKTRLDGYSLVLLLHVVDVVIVAESRRLVPPVTEDSDDHPGHEAGAAGRRPPPPRRRTGEQARRGYNWHTTDRGKH